MASNYAISTKNIYIYRQGQTNNFWVKWSLTGSQNKQKITRNVYTKVKKKKWKKKKTTKNFSSCISSYSVLFKYKVSNNTGTWYTDKILTGLKDGSVGTRAELWTPPEDAVAISVQVLAVSSSYKSGKKKTDKWFKQAWSGQKILADYTIYPASAPTINTFTITDKKVNVVSTINIADYNLKSKGAIKYQILKDNSEFVTFEDDKNYHVDKFDKFPESGVFTFETTLTMVGSYQVRVAIANYVSASKDTPEGYKWSEYSSWSSSVDTRPQAPTIKSVKAIGADQVKIDWEAVPNITQYKIEYVYDNTRNFDSDMIQSKDAGNVTSYIVTGLEAGHTIWFRMRSVNSSDESSPSDPPIDVILATKPSAPSTWSSTTKTSITSDVSTTDPLYLYWIHNSTDGSAQQYAKLQFKILDDIYYLTKENTETDEYGEKIDKTSKLSLWDLTVYNDEANSSSAGTIYSVFKAAGAKLIEWKVSTKGAHESYSDWSIERTIEAYEKPNLELSVTDSEGNPLVGDILKSFPLRITGIVTPVSQTPISFYMSITAGESYSKNDSYGDSMEVNNGDEIFSKYLDVDTLDYNLTPADVDFVSGISYKLVVYVYTDAGLNAEASYDFSPEWEEILETPEAIIDINETYRYADINPYCNYFIGYDATSEAYIGTDISGTNNTPTVYQTSGIEAAIPGQMYINSLTDEVYICILGGDAETATWLYIATDYTPVSYFGTAISGENETPTVYSSSGIEIAVPGDMYFNSSTYETYVCILGGNASTATWLYRTKFDYSDANTWYSGEVITGDNDDDIYPDSGISSSVVDDYYFNTKTGDIFKCTVTGTAEEANWVYIWNCFWQVTPDISLSVYRKEPNGTFIAVKEGIDNTHQSSDDAITVRDPHPSFGECNYRIVATNNKTGAIGFTDIVEQLDESSVIIQWDEVWNDVTENPDGELFEGSILELPANIKISDQNSNDVDLVSYIGRERPVTYYGTQRGESLSINCDFPKEDTDTLATLRRLMAYRGDAYVREPSGLGYWANVTVSYNREYSSLVIPVTLTVKPVEGGI